MFKKVTFVLIIIIALLVVGYVFLKEEKPLTGGDSFIYECSGEVTSEKRAAECFNLYFVEEIKALEEERGELSEEIIYMYSEVDEENIFIYEDSYHIERDDGYGSPYFIEDSKIIMQHG